MNNSLLLSHTQENERYTWNVIQVIGSSLFIALCAQIKIPLWFTPVPLSLQTLSIMIIGGMLGPRKGAMAAIAYLAQISAGLPFCAGGMSDSLALIGPRAGYLFGMAIQAYLAGWIFEKRGQLSSMMLLPSLFAVSLIQLGLGTLWLATFVGTKNAPIMGFFPFIPGEIVKVIAAATFCKIASEAHTK